MIRIVTRREAYIQPSGRKRKHPHYTVAELMVDVHRFPIRNIYFVPDIDTNRCVEVTTPILVELLNKRRSDGPPEVSPVLLTIPREGIAVVTMNPGYRRRKAGTR